MDPRQRGRGGSVVRRKAPQAVEQNRKDTVLSCSWRLLKRAEMAPRVFSSVVSCNEFGITECTYLIIIQLRAGPLCTLGESNSLIPTFGIYKV